MNNHSVQDLYQVGDVVVYNIKDVNIQYKIYWIVIYYDNLSCSYLCFNFKNKVALNFIESELTLIANSMQE